MRSKAERGRKDEKSLPSTSFQLGDLVICRYSNYPYWPATIDQTHQEKTRGKFSCHRRTRNGENVLSFWCTFSNEDTGGWVRFDRMVRYHPDLVDAIELDSDHEMHTDQRAALEVALKAFEKLPASARNQKPTTNLPRDFSLEKVNEEDGNMLQSDASDEEEPADPTTTTTPADPDAPSAPPAADGNGAAEEEDDPMDIGPHSTDDDAPAKRPRKASARPAPAPRANKRRVSAPPELPTRGGARGRPKKERLKVKEARKPPAKRKAVTTTSTQERKRSRMAVTTPDKRVSKRLVEEKEADTASVAEPSRRDRRSSAANEVLSSRSEPRDRSAVLESVRAELAAAKQTIQELKAELSAKDEQMASVTVDMAGAKFVLPAAPDNVRLEMPEQSEYHTTPVDARTFADAMEELRKGFDTFKQTVKVAEQVRAELSTEINRLHQTYKEKCDTVVGAEGKAVKQEKILIGVLSDLVKLKVDVPDLRSHRAGNYVRSVGKTCKQMPLIHEICNEIYVSWQRQVLEYLNENKGGGDANSREKPKGDTSGISDGKKKSSGDDGASASASVSALSAGRRDDADDDKASASSDGSPKKVDEEMKDVPESDEDENDTTADEVNKDGTKNESMDKGTVASSKEGTKKSAKGTGDVNDNEKGNDDDKESGKESDQESDQESDKESDKGSVKEDEKDDEKDDDRKKDVEMEDADRSLDQMDKNEAESPAAKDASTSKDDEKIKAKEVPKKVSSKQNDREDSVNSEKRAENEVEAKKEKGRVSVGMKGKKKSGEEEGDAGDSGSDSESHTPSSRSPSSDGRGDEDAAEDKGSPGGKSDVSVDEPGPGSTGASKGLVEKAGGKRDHKKVDDERKSDS